jgi:hypothetical protein
VTGVLRWAVKESFLGYVGGLDDGFIETFDGAEFRDGVFLFPVLGDAEDGLRASGGLRCTGFGGALDVRIADPWVGGGEVSALIGPASIAARVVIATFDAGAESIVPCLTFEGVRLFGDVYAVGTQLAPILHDTAKAPWP